ncbi:AAA family ATPase [Desulfatibacillum aliphaticivorans]|uniref:AAA family ATPase n=1 Tax=Desulfatibacillum aliphaticivorans TaxID=218208 RepID=UPI0003F99959|nr:MoxR family ATPase [Desulfatibacillum aliphaticivorans]
MNADTHALQETLAKAREEVAKVIIGQEHVVKMCLIAIFTRQHALIEGVPGLGKTLLVRTLAKVLGCDFSRIQFTPDLMPADITGTHMFNMSKNVFSLVRGPVFTTFCLADEINRAPAKTQSALLQAMQEREVSIDRKTYPLDKNFTVFATQNPIEFEGTYPLPEAQKDRFMLKIIMEPPLKEEELMLAKRMVEDHAPEKTLSEDSVNMVASPENLTELAKCLNDIVIKEELINYAVDIVRKTRSHKAVLVGSSPRGTQGLLLASRANAAMEDRDFVTPDDIKATAVPVLAHRLVLRPEFELEGLTVDEVIERILQDVTVPR